MKWLSETISRIVATAIAGAILVTIAYPITPRARMASLSDSLRPVRPVVIREDDGGLVESYIHFYDALRDSGVSVVLSGECDSACTLVLALPKDQVCITDGAVLGFHLATVGGKPDPRYTDIIQRRFYPPAVLDWLKKQSPLTLEMTYMPADTMLELGIFRHC